MSGSPRKKLRRHEGSGDVTRFTDGLMADGNLPFESSVAAAEVDEDDEAPLVEACRGGDRAAFDQLYLRHQPTVRAMALRRGCPAEEAEDVVHEVFMTLWKRPPKLRATKLSTWMYGVTANCVASLHRRRKVRRAFALASRPATHPTAAAHTLETRNLVAEVLSRMSPAKREVLVLHELEGRTGPEIAKMVGCRLNTVWTRLHYARLDFRKWVDRLQDEEEGER